jgi:hypothetical protein
MAEITSCPSCQRKLQVPETLSGQDVQCPSCGATFVARIGGELPSKPSPIPADRSVDHRDDRPRRRRGRDLDDDDDYNDDDFGSDQPRRRDVSPHRGALILVLGILGFFICVTVWMLLQIGLFCMAVGMGGMR